MLTQNPWSISTTSWPWSSHRFLRLSMSSRSRALNAMWFDPRLEPEARRDGRVERRHAVVVQLPERDQLGGLALDHVAGGVEDVLRPAARQRRWARPAPSRARSPSRRCRSGASRPGRGPRRPRGGTPSREHRVPSCPVRARRGLIVGWLLVGCYAAALVAATVTTHDAVLRPGERLRRRCCRGRLHRARGSARERRRSCAPAPSSAGAR